MIDIRTARGEGERAVFLGNTDSGKTFLIQQLAAPMQSVVVMDSKGDSMWDSYAARHGYLVSGDPADIRRHARVIFRVDSRSLMDRAGWTKPGSAGHVWTDALASCWFRSESGVTLVIFDEALDTLPSAGGAHPDARRIFTSGRTQGLPAWLGAQFPIYVDRRALGTAEHCFSFAQPMPEYRELIRQRRGVPADLLADLDAKAHEFAHHRLGESEWTEFSAVSAGPKSPAPEVPAAPEPVAEAGPLGL